MAFRSRTPPNAVPPRSRSEEISEPTAGLPGRRKAAQDTRRHTHQKREEQQARVDARVQSVRRRVARQERDQSPHGKRGQRDSEQSPGKREQDAVGKKLPADPPARSAQAPAVC